MPQQQEQLSSTSLGRSRSLWAPAAGSHKPPAAVEPCARTRSAPAPGAPPGGKPPLAPRPGSKQASAALPSWADHPVPPLTIPVPGLAGRTRAGSSGGTRAAPDWRLRRPPLSPPLSPPHSPPAQWQLRLGAPTVAAHAAGPSCSSSADTYGSPCAISTGQLWLPLAQRLQQAAPPAGQAAPQRRRHPQQEEEEQAVVFSWLLQDFGEAREPAESPPFTLCGQEWCLVAHPRGLNGRGRHLSLYLAAAGGGADSPFACWQQRLAFTLSVASSGGEGVGVSRSEVHTFSATEPQWGFTALAPRARLLDPAAGFLRPDGALLLRATCRPVAEPGGGL